MLIKLQDTQEALKGTFPNKRQTHTNQTNSPPSCITQSKMSNHEVFKRLHRGQKLRTSRSAPPPCLLLLLPPRILLLLLPRLVPWSNSNLHSRLRWLIRSLDR